MRNYLIASLAALLLLTCAVTLDPIWATNDDVALAMLGSGFGIALAPTSQLVFAHPLYGVALNTLAPILGTAAHGWLTVCGLMLAAGTVALALAPGRFGLPTLAVCWLALLLPATLSPQFTITAGLLFAAGAAWFLADGKGRIGCWLAIAALVFGYILRPESFYLGLLVLAPILLLHRPWRPGRTRDLLVACMLIVVVGYATSWLWLQTEPGWQQAIQANRLRAMFTDFHRVPWVPGNLAYKAAGWTNLDYAMFMDWYPYDAIFAPDRLATLIRAVGLPPLASKLSDWARWFSMPRGWSQLTLTLATTILLGTAIRRWRDVLAWFAGAAGCLCLLGWSGRPPLERVWLTLLAVAATAAAALALRASAKWRQRTTIIVALLVSVAIAGQAISAHAAQTAQARAYRHWLAEHPWPAGQPLVIWAAALKYEWVVSVLESYDPFPRDGIIGIGALADSPVQRAVRARLGIKDVSAWLCHGSGTTLMALHEQIPLLTRFCIERMGSAPIVHQVAAYGAVGIYDLSSPKNP